jgi:hypothetical protein
MVRLLAAVGAAAPEKGVARGGSAADPEQWRKYVRHVRDGTDHTRRRGTALSKGSTGPSKRDDFSQYGDCRRGRVGRLAWQRPPVAIQGVSPAWSHTSNRIEALHELLVRAEEAHGIFALATVEEGPSKASSATSKATSGRPMARPPGRVRRNRRACLTGQSIRSRAVPVRRLRTRLAGDRRDVDSNVLSRGPVRFGGIRRSSGSARRRPRRTRTLTRQRRAR